MGLYYTQFIDKIKEEFLKQNDSLESFLESQMVQDIYIEYEVNEGSLHWALNMEKIFNDLSIKPVKFKNKINKPLEDNFKDWKNDDFKYLKNK